MKIEKLNKENIKEFIRNMRLDDNADKIIKNIDKSELYAIKKDDTFYLCFNSLGTIDMIAILYYSPKLTSELFYECIHFLNKSLVARNHLIIEIYEEKYMKLLDDKYKCREVTVSLSTDGSIINGEDISGNNILMKEKFIDIEMRSIKYFNFKDMIVCNLFKQNIQDEKVINNLHDDFVNRSVLYVNFTIFPDSLQYFESLGYKCMCKTYVIRN